MQAAESFTLIELFLQVVLVRLVAADPVQTLRRQTCEHRQEVCSGADLRDFTVKIRDENASELRLKTAQTSQF